VKHPLKKNPTTRWASSRRSSMQSSKHILGCILLHNWQKNELSKGNKGLDARIVKEIAENEGGTVWRREIGSRYALS
jgi:hypothetical protein